MVTKNTNDVVPEHNTQSNEKKECRPLNVFSGGFICLLLLSIVWTFYSVAIEILPMQEYQKECPEYNSIKSNWSSSESIICKEFLDTLRSFDTTASTFWSLMITSGISPWIVLCLIAVITSHDKVSRKHKEYFWFLLGMLLAIYFVSLIVTSFVGPHVYLIASPIYLAVPLMCIIPGIVFYMFTNKICKNVMSIVINLPVIITYIMVVVSLVILTSYMVWQPDNYQDLLYKGNILLGCAWFFAFLAAFVMSYQIHFVYTYEDYAKPVDYSIKSYNGKNDETVEPAENDISDIEQQVIAAKQNFEELNYEKYNIIILGHILSFSFLLFITSWLSISQAAANITILVLIAVFPFIANFVIHIQRPFNQFIVSKLK